MYRIMKLFDSGNELLAYQLAKSQDKHHLLFKIILQREKSLSERLSEVSKMREDLRNGAILIKGYISDENGYYVGNELLGVDFDDYHSINLKNMLILCRNFHTRINHRFYDLRMSKSFIEELYNSDTIAVCC